ncbi:hypothetical protein evm_004550 [Chilo suppressalis]|nr:hypothetical protein evm_004550 [Chilo suppressalis]
MSDELEARMWDDGGSRYESRSRGAFFESAFASSEHLDRAPLLSEETYTDVPVASSGDGEEHCHWKPQAEPPSAVPQLLTALVLCGFFMVCELIGGYLAGSLSVMSDAAHMLSDCGGFALALLAFHCAKRQPDARMSYGYKRAEVLGAMVSVLLIWILTGVFVYVAAVRLHSGEYSIEPDMMMVVSGCGVVFNVVLALVLHGCASDIAHHHSHGGAACAHSHAHSHAHAAPESRPALRWFRRAQHKQPSGNGPLVNGDYTMKDLSNTEANVVGPQTRNINLRAALIHVIGDLIQSCGVLLASIIIKIYPINVPNAGAQAFPMDGIGRLGHDPPRGPSADCAGRFSRHGALNDLIRRSLATVNVPSLLEPTGIARDDGKRPDGMSLISWKMGRVLVWDATSSDTLAPSHLHGTNNRAGAAWEAAEKAKACKYRGLGSEYDFVPFGAETLGPWGPNAIRFFKEISIKLIDITGDRRAGRYLGQRISLAIQREYICQYLRNLA